MEGGREGVGILLEYCGCDVLLVAVAVAVFGGVFIFLKAEVLECRDTQLLQYHSLNVTLEILLKTRKEICIFC